MKHYRNRVIFFVCISALCFVSCKSELDNDTVISVNFSDVSNKKQVINLSEWVSEPEFIALDSSGEDAFSESSYCRISENYIGVYGSHQEYKLYDRKTGKYLRNIGQVGKESGEYRNVFSSVIDEQNSIVYILPWSAKEVLGYNIDSGELKELRPLKYSVPKGSFAIDSHTGELTVATLPFKGIAETVVWKQDKENNTLWEIPSEQFSVIPDFSNTVSSGFNTENSDFSITTLEGRVDSLYVVEDGFLKPIFTMNFLKENQEQHKIGGKSNLPYHTYTLLPKHILTSVSMQIRKPNGILGFSKPIYIVTDRKTEKSFQADFHDDMLYRELDYLPFSQGYYWELFSAKDFIKLGKQALSKGKLSEASKAKISSILKTLTPESNGVIMLAPLKN